MEKVLREHFAAVRQQRGLTQTQVATRGGVKQSTISKIEIEPDYEPSVSSFLKAIEGIGLTASAFFAQIEGLPTAISADVPPPAMENHDDLPEFDSEDRIAARVVRLLTRYAVKGLDKSSAKRKADHRLPADARPLAAERSVHARTRRNRSVSPSKKKRPPQT